MKIPESSKVQIFINNDYETTVECPLDAEIENNSITMLNGWLLCTDAIDCVKQISENEYRLDTWLQDCVFVSDGKLYDSKSKVD